MYIADLDYALGSRGIGGIVLLAKNREALEDMMSTLKRFLKERKMKISTEMSKILIFNSSGKINKEKWNWNTGIIEEVKSFKYLGFTFNRGKGTTQNMSKN